MVIWRIVIWALAGGAILSIPLLYAGYAERKYPGKDWPAVVGYVLLIGWMLLLTKWVIHAVK